MEVQISGDERYRTVEWHIEQCKDLLALCELYDVLVWELAIFGSRPVVYTDYGKIVQYSTGTLACMGWNPHNVGLFLDFELTRNVYDCLLVGS